MARSSRVFPRRGRLVPPIDTPQKPDNTDDTLKRIDAITGNARATWLSLIGVLVFAGITLLGVEDVDFFAVDRATKLPLVSVSVPVESFFWAGATVVTALYVYFHLYLELLWTALGEAPARVDGAPLSERIRPWLVSEWALRLRDRLRLGAAKKNGRPMPEASSATRHFGWVGDLMSILLVWTFGLVVLGYFWWRSLPAHEDAMSLWLGFLFVFALWVAWRSLTAMNSGLEGSEVADADPYEKPGRGEIIKGYLQFAAFIAGMAFLTLIKTGSDWVPGEHALWKEYPDGETARWIKLYKADGGDYWAARLEEAPGLSARARVLLDLFYTEFFFTRIVSADLFEAQLVDIPDDWLSRDDGEREFRAEWAQREGLSFNDPFPDVPERDVEAEFQSVLADAIKKASSAGTDAAIVDMTYLRARWAREQGLRLSDPFARIASRSPEEEFQTVWKERRGTYLETKPKPDLSNRNLRFADLAGAFFPGGKLAGARLEGANLDFARLEGADLRGARLEGAYLNGAGLEGAILRRARLEGANLRRARLEGANLRGAQLEGADLRNAWLERADLAFARLEGADLSDAWLKGADLRNAWLERAYLRDARLEGADLRGAWLKGADLIRARLEDADLKEAQLDGADLSNARLEGADLIRARLQGVNLRSAGLEGANLGLARLEGAYLGFARLEGAYLRLARLEGANLVYARLEGADLRNAGLEGADLSNAQLKGADLSNARLKGADLTGARLEGANVSFVLLSGTPENALDTVFANLSEANFTGSALRFVSLDAANMKNLRNFENSFGDGSVALPDDVAVPKRWCFDTELSDKEFFGRWRGWLEKDSIGAPIRMSLLAYDPIAPSTPCPGVSGE